MREAEQRATSIVRLVEQDMSEAATLAWRSAGRPVTVYRLDHRFPMGRQNLPAVDYDTEQEAETAAWVLAKQGAECVWYAVEIVED